MLQPRSYVRIDLQTMSDRRGFERNAFASGRYLIPKGFDPIAQGKRSATMERCRETVSLPRRGCIGLRPLSNPFGVSFRGHQIPRVALRLPWAIGSNPLGVRTNAQFSCR